jgi:ATP-binding cassette subfamily F protein 3
MLAKVLAQAEKADLLILDEPTNPGHRRGGVAGGPPYGVQGSGAYRIPRPLLPRRTVTQVYELENAKLRHYGGNYSQFVDKKALELERQRKEYEKNVKERDRQARIADEQHRALWFSSTHKTRLKMLQRMEVKEAPDKKRDLSIDFSAAQKSGKNMVIARKLKVTRGKKVIFEDLDLDVNNGDKIGLFVRTARARRRSSRPSSGTCPPAATCGWPGSENRLLRSGHDLMDPKLTALEQINKSLEATPGQGEVVPVPLHAHPEGCRAADIDPLRRGEGQGRSCLVAIDGPELPGAGRADQLP